MTLGRAQLQKRKDSCKHFTNTATSNEFDKSEISDMNEMTNASGENKYIFCFVRSLILLHLSRYRSK